MAFNRPGTRTIIRAVLMVVIIVFVINLFSTKQRKGKAIDHVSVAVLTKEENRGLKRYLNKAHVALAKDYGLGNPIESADSFHEDQEEFCDDNDLVRIEDTPYYIVGYLTHSLPYQKEFVKDFLDDLGERFDQRLEDEGLKQYRFVLTSLLRTIDHQRKLQRTNLNATPNISSHYFGTAIDISMTRFVPFDSRESLYSYRLRNLLARTLLEMQDEERCYIVMEKREKCFHITVNDK